MTPSLGAGMRLMACKKIKKAPIPKAYQPTRRKDHGSKELAESAFQVKSLGHQLWRSVIFDQIIFRKNPFHWCHLEFIGEAAKDGGLSKGDLSWGDTPEHDTGQRQPERELQEFF